MLARHDLGDQPRAMQPREVLVRKAAVSVVAGRVGGQLRREAVEQRGDACVVGVGIVGGQEAQRTRLRRWRGSGKAGGHRDGFPGQYAK